MAGMKKGGKVKKYADGGMPSQSNKGGAMRGLARAAAMSGRTMPATGRPTVAGRPVGAAAPMRKGGSVKPTAMGRVVAGGKRPHGEHTVQQKGHTKAMMPKMKRGGKC